MKQVFSVPSASQNLPCCSMAWKQKQKKTSFWANRSWKITHTHKKNLLMKQPNLPSIQVCNECHWIEIRSPPLCLRSNARAVSPVSDCQLWSTRSGAALRCCIAGVSASLVGGKGWVMNHPVLQGKKHAEMRFTGILWDSPWRICCGRERLRAGIAQPAEEMAPCV